MNIRIIKIILAAILLLITTSCNTLLDNNEGVFGKASTKSAKLGDDIILTQNAQAQLNEEKLEHIGALSQGGVGYALNKIPTNSITPEIDAAKQMNERIEALAGKPNFDEVKEIRAIVDDLTSQIDKVKKEGERALAKKDKEIQGIQQSAKELDIQRENQITQALAQANLNALKADQYQQTLKDMDKFGGLGAVFYGLKKFLVRSAWILGVGGGIFVFLRILSFSNPLAASIFSIFSTIGSWFIHTIEYILPKAVDTAGYVTKSIYNDAQIALNEVITGIQTAEASGKQIPASHVIASVASSLTPTQQAQIASNSLTPASSAVLNTIVRTPIDEDSDQPQDVV